MSGKQSLRECAACARARGVEGNYIQQGVDMAGGGSGLDEIAGCSVELAANLDLETAGGLALVWVASPDPETLPARPSSNTSRTAVFKILPYRSVKDAVMCSRSNPACIDADAVRISDRVMVAAGEHGDGEGGEKCADRRNKANIQPFF